MCLWGASINKIKINKISFVSGLVPPWNLHTSRQHTEVAALAQFQDFYFFLLVLQPTALGLPFGLSFKNISLASKRRLE